MIENWLEVAWINCTKAIMHGHLGDTSVERVLSDDEREQLYDLNERHQREMQKLLQGFAS